MDDSRPDLDRRRFLGLGALTAGAALTLAMTRKAEAQTMPAPGSPNYLRLTECGPANCNDYSGHFAQAMEQLGSAGGTIFIPRGLEYPITNKVIVKPNIQILGEGDASTVRLVGNAGFLLNGSENFSLSNFRIKNADANGKLGISTNPSTSGDGPRNGAIEELHLEGCGIELMSGAVDVAIVGNHLSGTCSGVSLDEGCERILISGNHISNTSFDGGLSGHGILCHKNVKQVILSDNIVRGCFGNGIYLTKYSLGNIVITGNVCSGNRDCGINVVTDSDSNSVGLIISGNVCDGNGTVYSPGLTGCGIQLRTPQGVSTVPRWSRSTITGNTCSGNNGAGIFLRQMMGVAVSGNFCGENNASGILAVGCAFLAITSNNALNNNLVPAHPAINELAPNIAGFVLNSCQNCTVTSNISQGIADLASTTNGFAEKESTSVQNVFLGNISSGYTTPMVSDGVNTLLQANQPNGNPSAYDKGYYAARFIQGDGIPDGAVIAPPGSIYQRVNPNSSGSLPPGNPYLNQSNSVLWVKDFGTGSLGWRPL